MNNLMIDLETLGTKSNCPILSIAAVEFDIKTGEIGNQFYQTINLQDCLDLGLKISADTFNWWLKQNEQARLQIASKDGLKLKNVLIQFNEFLSQKEYIVWGNSARFDLGILENAFNLCDLKQNWLFYNERDLRTLFNLNPLVREQVVFKGVPHNPIDDCIYQIEYCSKIFNSIKI